MQTKNQMSLHHLEDFTRGWIIGQFSPSLLPTDDFEFGVKMYKKGDFEAKHYHKIAREFTVIVTGKFKMNDKFLEAGDIVLLEQETPADFLCVEDGATAVIKVPSAPNDKFLVEKDT
jgi:hypothetical protein